MASEAQVPKTLPARYFTDGATFQRDLEVFFWDSWIYAGRVERVKEPGDYFLVDVGGESLIVTRNRDGAIHSFYNVCRHRGTRLCTVSAGTFDGAVQCPY